MNATKPQAGLTRAQAKTVEYTIIAFCLFALVSIFQPFSMTLFSIGCGLIIFAGLAFNLVPLCEPGVTVRSLVKAAGIILLILAIVALIGMGTAQLYVAWLAANRPG